MSTIPSASPRPSISSISTTDTAPAPADRSALRRNKAAALRDYYGLRSAPAQPSDSLSSAGGSPNLHNNSDTEINTIRESDIDRADFDPRGYVEGLLAREGVEGVLRVEAGLLSEIRSLDGEKKALVYDNYSKLIAATETIRKMREKMDPLTPATTTLTPAIGHIAERASALSQDLRSGREAGVEVGGAAGGKKRGEKATVMWVLAAPGRLRRLKDMGKGEEAEKEWREVSGLLDKWSGVRGVEEVRKGCLEALQSGGGDVGG